MRNIAALLVMSLLVACADRSDQHAAPCRGVDEIPNGDLFLFGEMHGSAEAPALIADIACVLSARGDVTIGLEIPSTEQGKIDKYLASAGTDLDEAQLLATSFWRNGDDGRSSIAMSDLIRSVRTLNVGGRSVEVFAFDSQANDGSTRDEAMAASIRNYHRGNPYRTLIALMGNIHAMQETFVGEDFRITPAGELLKDLAPISILIAYPKGTVWACMPDCGVHDVSPRSSAPDFSGFREGATMNGYNYTYFLDSITASPPAISERQ